jgi:hypothetical protein
MAIEIRTHPEKQGLWIAQSESDPDMEYELSLTDDGITCNCLGYQYRSVCKHSLRLAGYLMLLGDETAAQSTSIPQDLAVPAGLLQGHVFTGRFQDQDTLAKKQYAPVRITIAPPRFPLRYELAGIMLSLAPTSATFALKGKPGFEAAYRAQLDELGPSAVLELLSAKREEVDGREIVLCCYEDVLVKQGVCHRRILASWLAEHTGLIVEEIA